MPGYARWTLKTQFTHMNLLRTVENVIRGSKDLGLHPRPGIMGISWAARQYLIHKTWNNLNLLRKTFQPFGIVGSPHHERYSVLSVVTHTSIWVQVLEVGLCLALHTSNKKALKCKNGIGFQRYLWCTWCSTHWRCLHPAHPSVTSHSLKAKLLHPSGHPKKNILTRKEEARRQAIGKVVPR